eukprot:275170-Amphidinium_carterae.1
MMPSRLSKVWWTSISTVLAQQRRRCLLIGLEYSQEVQGQTLHSRLRSFAPPLQYLLPCLSLYGYGDKQYIHGHSLRDTQTMSTEGSSLVSLPDSGQVVKAVSKGGPPGCVIT